MQEDLLSNATLIDVPAVLALFASASRGYRRAIAGPGIYWYCFSICAYRPNFSIEFTCSTVGPAV